MTLFPLFRGYIEKVLPIFTFYKNGKFDFSKLSSDYAKKLNINSGGEFFKAKTYDEKVKAARLAIVEAVRIGLENSLKLLGMEAPERM